MQRGRKGIDAEEGAVEEGDWEYTIFDMGLESCGFLECSINDVVRWKEVKNVGSWLAMT